VFALALADTVGAALTVTNTLSVTEHPLELEVKVYVVVVVDEQVGFETVDELKFVAGDQQNCLNQ
jgi:hypothetical protein